MGELPMTPVGHYQYPTVSLKKSDDFAYLHTDSLPDRDPLGHVESATFPPNVKHNPRRFSCSMLSTCSQLFAVGFML